MAKTQIYGELNRRSKKLAIFQSQATPEKWSAIERFTNESGHLTHVMTPIPKELLGEPASLNRYLENMRREKGSIVSAMLYTANLKTTHSKGLNHTQVRTARDIHSFTNEIKGDPHRKSLKRLRQLVKMQEDNDRYFFSQILIIEPQKSPTHTPDQIAR